jgi:xanthine dehydrogenase accessory factor
MRDVLATLNDTVSRRRACVYCAVVETRGSTPQKAGAAMLVFPDGGQQGTLGGGCIEAEVKQRALRVLHQGEGKAEVLTFCLDDNYGWDDGLICGGRMAILADPLLGQDSEQGDSFYRHYRQLIESGQGCTEAVVLSAVGNLPPGSRCLFNAEGKLLALRAAHGEQGAESQTAREEALAAIAHGLKPLSSRPGPWTQHGVAYLPTLPRVTLLIVGGGHVGQSVAQLASQVDFDVWVLDDREKYASPERFPMASRRVVGDIGMTLKELVPTLGKSCYALIVTRGHNHDEEALYHLAGADTGYLGMIGSRRKIRLIYEDLLARGITQEQLARVHAPLGFSIGSQTVMEIAISIVAELIAARNLGTTAIEPRRPIQVETAR